MAKYSARAKHTRVARARRRKRLFESSTWLRRGQTKSDQARSQKSNGHRLPLPCQISSNTSGSWANAARGDWNSTTTCSLQPTELGRTTGLVKNQLAQSALAGIIHASF